MGNICIEQPSLFESIKTSNSDIEYNDFFLNHLNNLLSCLSGMSIDEKIQYINKIKIEVHKISPFKYEPVDCVIWEKSDNVIANDYNPNSVAPTEMELLELSIKEDGYTQPIVTFDIEEHKEVVDGFHRNRVGKESKIVRERVMGYLPIVVINDNRTDKGDRIAATIRHNRARGKHRIDKMSDIVIDLKKRNWSDEKIAKHLGMDADEVLRLSQISGLAEIFSDKEFSEAWEAELSDDDVIEITG